jgi:hypothetical protein
MMASEVGRMTPTPLAGNINRWRLLGSAAAMPALMFAGFSIMGTGFAFAESVVEAAKSDRAVVLASLDWQPNDPSSAEWVAFKPVAKGPDPAARSSRSPAPPTPDGAASSLNDAFDLFARSEPVKLADSKGFQLRTASIDPGTAWGAGTSRIASDASQTAGAPSLNSAAAVPANRLGFLIPIPRAKPPVPRVQLASLTGPTELPEEQNRARPLDTAPVLGEPRRIPEGATAYLDIFRREASLHKIPLWLALGVAWVESKFDPKLRGTHTVVGMMQVMPSTAREMGYKGTTNQLFEPETNIIWGMNELAQDYQIAKGDICLTIAKYKGGFHTRSINKGAWNYCSQVKHVTGMAEVAAK